MTMTVGLVQKMTISGNTACVEIGTVPSSTELLTLTSSPTEDKGVVAFKKGILNLILWAQAAGFVVRLTHEDTNANITQVNVQLFVRVLVVADGIFNFTKQTDITDDTFTIFTLVDTLNGSSFPQIIVHTAHRQGDPLATITMPFNFATSIPDLSVYDEIWMFGYLGSNFGGSGRLNFISEAELQAIAKFMDGGGGVLATGDHDGLGSLMCGKILRVRSMRKWFAQTDNDPSIPVQAPRNWPAIGPTRADTLQPDHDGNWNFDNQSDDIPQSLDFPNGTVHPILLGPNGPISRFPDHMHEGEVITPWTLWDPLTFNGQQFVEYPGHQEAPRIIATGKVIGGHATPLEGSQCEQVNFIGAKDPTVANDNLAILCVYDGHNAGVGRVVTDSSFHHYIDLNLIGDPCGIDDKQRGFGTAAGQDILADIKSFYINTAVWLARANPRKFP